MNPAGATPPLRLTDPEAQSSVLRAEQERGMGSLDPHPSPSSDTVIYKLARPGRGLKTPGRRVLPLLKETEKAQLEAAWAEDPSPRGVHSVYFLG